MGSARSAEVLISQPSARRRYRSKQERRQIVEETLQPGASVAVIARQHGVNANQVFAWRKLYREGRLDAAEATRRRDHGRGGSGPYPNRRIGGPGESPTGAGEGGSMISPPTGTNIW